MAGGWGMIYLDYGLPVVDGCNFLWGEYAYLPRWDTFAIPSEQERKNAQTLFGHLQRLIRDPLKKPIRITSGARPAAYNKLISKATKSAHISWEAVDLAAPAGMSNAEFWHFCDARWPGRMEQLAFTPTWVHLDTREWGKRLRVPA